MAPPMVILESGSNRITNIVDIPGYELTATSSCDGMVRVYSSDKNGIPIQVFAKHTRAVTGLLHLLEDILLSVDSKGTIFTWRARTGEEIGKCDLLGNKKYPRRLAKLSPSKVAIGSDKAGIQIVKHKSGRNLVNSSRGLSQRDYGSCNDIDAYGHVLVSVNSKHSANVWKTSTGAREAVFTFKHDSLATSVSVTDKYIVTACEDGKVYVRRKNGDFSHVSTFDIANFRGDAKCAFEIYLSFIGSGVMMVATRKKGIFFIALTSAECIAHFKPEFSTVGNLGANEVRCAMFLSGARLGIGGHGYCAIVHAPQEVKEYMQNLKKSVGSNGVTNNGKKLETHKCADAHKETRVDQNLESRKRSRQKFEDVKLQLELEEKVVPDRKKRGRKDSETHIMEGLRMELEAQKDKMEQIKLELDVRTKKMEDELENQRKDVQFLRNVVNDLFLKRCE